jgi:hypothetical protein
MNSKVKQLTNDKRHEAYKDNEDQISEDNSFSSFESMDDNFVDFRRLFLLKKVLKSFKKFASIMD